MSVLPLPTSFAVNSAVPMPPVEWAGKVSQILNGFNRGDGTPVSATDIVGTGATPFPGVTLTATTTDPDLDLAHGGILNAEYATLGWLVGYHVDIVLGAAGNLGAGQLNINLPVAPHLNVHNLVGSATLVDSSEFFGTTEFAHRLGVVGVTNTGTVVIALDAFRPERSGTFLFQGASSTVVAHGLGVVPVHISTDIQSAPSAAGGTGGNGVVVWADTRDDTHFTLHCTQQDGSTPVGAPFGVNVGWNAIGHVDTGYVGDTVPWAWAPGDSIRLDCFYWRDL